MTNKEKLKKAMDEDFNSEKNYEQIMKKMGNVRKRNLLKWSIVPLCLLVMISGVFLLIGKKEDNITLSTFSTMENKETLNINDLSKSELSKVVTDVKIVDDVNIPYPFKISKEDDSKEKIIVLPSDLTQTKNSIVYTKKDSYSKEYNEIANYVMLLTNGNDRTIKIKYSKDKEPISDYSFREEKSKVTMIHGVDLKVYRYEESFFTLFYYNGYHFDIETSNITEQELSDYLNSVVW